MEVCRFLLRYTKGSQRTCCHGHTVSLLFFSQVSEVKQEELCLYLVPLEHKDFRDPQVLMGPKVLLEFYFTWRYNCNSFSLFSLTTGLAHNR